MREWSGIVEQKILKLTDTDADYQEILQQIRVKEADYRQILDALSPENAGIVDDYVALCEELLHQKVRLAYLAGAAE